MKNLKKLLISITCAFALLMVIPTILPNYGNTVEVQAAQSLTKNITMFKGVSFYITQSFGTPSQWKWSSSNPSAVTVSYDSAKGKYVIRSVGYGSATIQGYYAGNTIYYNITVAKLSKSKVGLYAGNTYTLSVSGSPTSVSYKSSNPSVATVNSKGKITAKKAGTATITATVYTTIGQKTLKKDFLCTVTVRNKTTTVQSNLNTLKNKIAKSSLVTSKGNHYIQRKTKSNTVTYTYRIYYISKNDCLQFSYTAKDSSSKKSVSISFNVYNISKTYKIAPKISITTPKGIKFATTTSLDRRSYTNSTKLTFSITSSNVTLTSAYKKNMQTLSNDYLQHACKGWNKLTTSKTGLALNKLGFTKYN